MTFNTFYEQLAAGKRKKNENNQPLNTELWKLTSGKKKTESISLLNG